MRQSEFNSETLKLVRNYYGLSQSAFAKKTKYDSIKAKSIREWGKRN